MLYKRISSALLDSYKPASRNAVRNKINRQINKTINNIMKKELLNIKIQTLPNGYALDVDNQKYMYHSLEGLVEGFMFHVGLSEKYYCSKEFIKDFIATAVAWKTGDGDLAKKNIELVDENKRLSSIIQTSKKTIKHLKERIKSIDKNSNESLNEDDEDDEDDEE